MLTRRALIGGGVALAAYRNDTLDVLARLDLRGDGGPDDEAYWAKVRSAFDVETEFLNLNHGGICPSPRVVQDAQDRRGRLAERAPAYHVFREQEKQVEPIRARLAKLFGADKEEIAILPNASTGLFTAVLGVPAGRDETMVATDLDYPRLLTALDQRGRRDGVRIVESQVPRDAKSPDDLAQVLTRYLPAKPKLMAFPRVAFLDGALFPAETICREAAKHGVPTLVDGAHAIGHLDDSAALGCDFYACCLHKWILGPLGTGFLYVRRERIKDTWPLGAADASLDQDVRKFEQFGTRDTARILAIGEALDAHEAIGAGRKSERLAYLRRHWTERLRDHPKIHFHSNLDPAMSRVLTTVQIKGVATNALAGWLFTKHRIFVTTMQRGPVDGIRATAQIFNTPQEMDRLVDALREAADHGIG